MSIEEDQQTRLDTALAEIRRRWGSRAIGRYPRHLLDAVPHMPTGFVELDALLGIGGIPGGRMSELMGIPTSGMVTIALHTLAGAQAAGGITAFVDANHTFDPDYAHRCGVRLDQMVLIRPASVEHLPALLPDLVGGRCDLLICDMPLDAHATLAMQQRFATMLGRLLTPLARTGCALLFLTTLPPAAQPDLSSYPAHATLPHFAAVRLLLHRTRWLYHHHDISGYEACVHVVKNKFAAAGQQVTLTVALR